jgi:hypothetical protein
MGCNMHATVRAAHQTSECIAIIQPLCPCQPALTWQLTYYCCGLDNELFMIAVVGFP